jgi:hypothetical protein
MSNTLTDAQRIVHRWDRLKAERGSFEALWQELADYLRPLRAEFTSRRSAGEKRYGKIFDSTPLLAADNFAGGIYGMMTNPANRWFSLRVTDDELNEFEPVRDWLYDVESRVLHSFGPQISRFYNVLPGLYADLAVFGTAIFYSEEAEGLRRISDNARPLSECVISESAYGDVDTVYRRFTLESRAALQLFPETLSSNARKAAEKDPFAKICFIHCVEPNEDYDPEKLGQRALPYQSIYIEEETRNEVSRKGYYEFPYQVPRWSQAAGEVYGRGLGEAALADIKTLNQQSRTALVSAQKAADPPLAAPDEGVIRVARTFPGGITYGAIDANGRLLLQPLPSGGNPGLTLEMMEQRRQAIREAFYFSLMQMVGAPDMTATEWLGRQEEKLRLMGPNLGRIQSEFLSPLIKRRFGILARAGQLPPAPPEIQGSALNVEYVSPLARAQMASEAQSIVRLYQSVMPIAQADPSVLDNIDHDEAVQTLGRGWAVPAKLLRGRDKVEGMRQQRQQMQAMQAGLAIGQQGAEIARKAAAAGKDAASAQQTADQASQAPAGRGGGLDIGSAINTLRQALRGQQRA